MNDHVWLKFMSHVLKKTVFFQKTFCRAEPAGLHEDLISSLFELDVIVIGHRVKAVYDKPLIKKQFGQMKADKARGAGDEYSFQIMLISLVVEPINSVG